MSTVSEVQGTLISWKSTGGTYAITLTSLANAAARSGVKGDLGATMGTRYGYRFKTKFGTNPTGGMLVRLFLAFSEDNTNFAGNCAGTDAGFTDFDDLRNMLELQPLIVDADTDAQQVVGEFIARARYVSPVVHNDATGQTLSSTAADNEFIIWPITGNIA